ncbi:MAG: hypothetical protein IKT27_06200 [Clostridia bacterium]|nr:hypothetical protein [Clostridia bacterium]
MTYSEMFDYLQGRGFTMDFDPTGDKVGFSTVRVYWKDISFGEMYFRNAMLYTAKDHQWVSQFEYGWNTNPAYFKEFVEAFIQSCEEPK